MLAQTKVSVVGLAVTFFVAVLSPQTVGGDDREFSIYLDTDAPGYDYNRFDPPSEEFCKSRCAADQHCKAFTYNRVKRVCFLKDRASFPLIHHGEATTGRKIADGRFSIKRDRDAPGHDYERIDPPSLSTCQSRCGSETDCRAFSYNITKQVCFLKYKGDVPLARHGEAVTGVKVARVSPPSQQQPAPGQQNLTSSGSGFAVSSDGLILTNRHVVANCGEITVVGEGSAVLKAVDERNDLALLKVNAATSAAKFRSTSAELGESVFALGFPFGGILGAGMNFTPGGISSLSGLGNDSRYFQFTAPVQPGNSGGPMVDVSGLVVGVVSGRLDDIEALKASGSLPQNVNFAIRGDLAQGFLRANGVEPTVEVSSSAPSASEVAKNAQPFTMQVLCSGQSAAASDHRRINAFVVNDYLNGDMGSASHLHSIYADRVDYWNKGEVPLTAVIADKLAYAHKWASLHYQARPGSITIEPVAGHQWSYRVQFDYDYLAANERKVVEGVARADLMVDLSDSSPRITAEHGSLLSRAVRRR